jgi:hypothetical protein
MLRALYDAQQGKSLGDVTQVPGLGSTAYVEAHVHGEIRFDRDIAKIVICSAEAMNAETELRKLVAAGKSYKVVTAKKLHETFEKFSRKHAILLVSN